MLFTECHNSTQFQFHSTNSICWGLDFCIGNKGVIFVDFFTIFVFKIFNINVESIKIVKELQNMDETTKRKIEGENFENLGQNWKISTKQDKYTMDPG